MDWFIGNDGYLAEILVIESFVPSKLVILNKISSLAGRKLINSSINVEKSGPNYLHKSP